QPRIRSARDGLGRLEVGQVGPGLLDLIVIGLDLGLGLGVIPVGVELCSGQLLAGLVYLLLILAHLLGRLAARRRRGAAAGTSLRLFDLIGAQRRFRIVDGGLGVRQGLIVGRSAVGVHGLVVGQGLLGLGELLLGLGDLLGGGTRRNDHRIRR